MKKIIILILTISSLCLCLFACGEIRSGYIENGIGSDNGEHETNGDNLFSSFASPLSDSVCGCKCGIFKVGYLEKFAMLSGGKSPYYSISSLAECENYPELSPLWDYYSESFFSKNRLVIFYIPTTTGSADLHISDITIKENVLSVSTVDSMDINAQHTCDMSGFYGVIEMPQSTVENLTNVYKIGGVPNNTFTGIDFDIDGDGEKEQITIGPGWTSGRSTISINVEKNGDTICSALYDSYSNKQKLFEENGKLYLTTYEIGGNEVTVELSWQNGNIKIQ